jgi:SAM-dependent methyltransferase
MSREFWSCVYCTSNVRWRSIIHALSLALFGKSLALPDFPERRDLAGIGLSDWDGYAIPLAKKLAYANTFYHTDPKLDITSIGPSQQCLYDFIISSDVFEHIPQPISKAFENARRLLKPGGAMIFTVPYVNGETLEHFPEASEFSVQKKGKHWVLLARSPDRPVQEFTDITFHGGPGTTVEFRLFGKDSLLRECTKAGFSPICIHDETMEEFGIVWNPYRAEKAPYRPLIHGLDTPPWILFNGGKVEGGTGRNSA